MGNKTLQDYHNDGQRDGANGECNPPHDLATQAVGFFTFTQDHFEQLMEENDAYMTGNKNGSESVK